MEMFFTVLLLAVALPMISIIMGYFIKEAISDSPSVAKFLHSADLEEARKYAAMFGLGNDHDVNVAELLAMGRKYAAYIGNERFEEIHNAIVQEHEAYYVSLFTDHDSSKVKPTRSRINRHLINKMMKGRELVVAVTSPSFITINKSFGGDRDGEPTTISTHRAA